jgi:hypothetical protein
VSRATSWPRTTVSSPSVPTAGCPTLDPTIEAPGIASFLSKGGLASGKWVWTSQRSFGNHSRSIPRNADCSRMGFCNVAKSPVHSSTEQTFHGLVSGNAVPAGQRAPPSGTWKPGHWTSRYKSSANRRELVTSAVHLLAATC